MAVWICGDCETRYSVGAPACPQCGANEPREEHEQSPLAIPSVTVACNTPGCAARGTQRRVLLQTVAQGVIARPSLFCAACGNEVMTVPGQQPAPDDANDQQEQQPEEEDDVPKVTVHTGASHEAAEAAGEEGPWTPDEPADEDSERSEQPSPGASSTTSSETPETSPKTSENEDQSPAPTTGNRSPKARAGASTARSTGGGRKTATGSDDSDK